ncbi:IS3 family transposase [Kozakia baliensis]
MSQKSLPETRSGERLIRDIRRATRRQYSAEEKIRIVLDGLRGESSIAELCRREGIAESLYYSWSKEFLEAGKKRLAGDTARNATTGEVRHLRDEARALKEVVAEQTLELRLLKKHDRGWGRPRMRYEASEKLEIIRLVEQSALSVRQVLEKIGVPRSTFHRWYDLYRTGGPEALADRPSRPNRTWNRIADDIRAQIVDLALEAPQLSPREIAMRFTDERSYFVSEASVYRLLKARDLITSPTFIVIKAAENFHTKTTAPNQLWQTDFTYLKVIGWGWFYLSTILDDFSRYIIAWKLCTTMAASDVTDTLELALQASGLDQVKVKHRPRLLSDNGPCYVADELAKWLDQHAMDHVRGAPNHPQTQGKIERWHQTLKNRVLLEHYYLPGNLEQQIEAFVENYNHRRYHESLNNLTPADVWLGRGQAILLERERIKRDTIQKRRLLHQQRAA